MNLLFKRSQTTGQFGGVKFKLWGNVELDSDEKEIVERYRFDNAILIEADQPALIRNSLIIGGLGFVVAFALFSTAVGTTVAFLLSVVAGGGGGYFYFHQKRETIYVRDLIHGRYFSCDSVVDLARKEAWLGVVTSFLRQAMESAKHWDGQESNPIDPLPKDEARQVIIKGL